MQERIAIQTTL